MEYDSLIGGSGRQWPFHLVHAISVAGATLRSAVSILNELTNYITKVGVFV